MPDRSLPSKTTGFAGRQWRACGKDNDHMDVETDGWTSEDEARKRLEELRGMTPHYDDVWLETRQVYYAEPRRVEDALR